MSTSKNHKTPFAVPRIADTLAQAAALTGLPINDLKAAKRAGCPAFVGSSRVNLEVLKAWVLENPVAPDEAEDGEKLESKDVLERRRIRAQWKRSEFQLSVEQGKYISREERDRADARNAAAVRSQLLAFAANIPTWEGKRAFELKKLADEGIDKICKNLHDLQSEAYNT